MQSCSQPGPRLDFQPKSLEVLVRGWVSVFAPQGPISSMWKMQPFGMGELLFLEQLKISCSKGIFDPHRKALTAFARRIGW